MMSAVFDIFLTAPPGLEAVLASELTALGFAAPTPEPGGVTVRGGWAEVWRANLQVRGATRVLARIDAFRAGHLSQLDKRARKTDWASVLRPDTPVRVEASCRKSKIYHSGAAAQRVARAITETVGAPVSETAELCVRVRLDHDLCTLSLDTSGAPLHKRGYKPAVAKAPLRETLAALFLRAAGYDGTQPLVDPMCGSGTFVIEAAAIAAGLAPGRARQFAFEQLAGFDPAALDRLRSVAPTPVSDALCHGFDRDPGAIRMSAENASRAGLTERTRFTQRAVDALTPPDGPAGLVMINPPYGARIGDKRRLHTLYRTLGGALKTRFSGWRVGLVTSEETLARMTGLTFTQVSAPVDHGGLTVKLYQAGPLG